MEISIREKDREPLIVESDHMKIFHKSLIEGYPTLRICYYRIALSHWQHWYNNSQIFQ